jgi:predicted transcriptional regulator
MRLLWGRGESAVADLVQALPDDTPLAYTTVLTTVRILEKKGYVRHRQVGRAFLYTPCVAEHDARQGEIRNLLQRFFGNSRERLLLSLLGDSNATPEEVEQMKRVLAEALPGDDDLTTEAPEV